jgi:GNAT superfamily N-acetyltransferase
MMSDHPSWRLREATDVDSDGLAALAEAAADAGRVSFRVRHVVPVMTAARLRRPGSRCAVVTDDHGTVIGAGWVSFSRGRVETQTRSLALLHSLAVHPHWRRRGIATALTRWRLAAVEQHDASSIVVAAIQAGNSGSEANARAWATQSLGDLTVTPTPVTHRPPPRHGAVAVRRARLAERDELDQIVTGFQAFSADHLLAPSVTAVDLRGWAATELDGRPLNAYFVATDKADRVVAGLGIEREAALSSLEVIRMPALTRAASRLLRVVPTDGMLHNLNIRLAWFAPGHEAAARQLWQNVRFDTRSEGTTLVTTLAGESPLRQMLATRAWAPRTTLRIVARAPRPLPVTGILGLVI